MRKLFLVALMAVGLSASVDVETYKAETKEEVDEIVEIINILHKKGSWCKLGVGSRFDLKDVKMQIVGQADEVYFIVGIEKAGDCITPIDIHSLVEQLVEQGDSK